MTKANTSDNDASSSSSMTLETLEGLIGGLEFWAPIFGVLVVIGVAGESVFGIRIWWNNRKLQAIQHAENVQLQRKISEANGRAGNAERDTEKLRESNLILQREVLELRERMADRHLTAKQQDTVASKLLQFTGEKVNIFAQSGDPEAVGLMADIGTAINKAHWGGMGCLEQAIRVIPGILVEVKPEAPERTKLAAASLVSALQSEGLFVAGPVPRIPGRVVVGGCSADLTIAIEVSIGKKPSKP